MGCRLDPVLDGQDTRAVRRVRLRRHAAMAPRHRQGVGHRGVLDAPGRDHGTVGARGDPRQAGRPHAGIQRLIGRALRSVTDLRAIGERMVTIDCDVLQADAGTRTASITGGYVALALALRGAGAEAALRDSVAAVSVGLVESEPRLDLCYEEDAGAEVDCNIVMTGEGRLVEVQGTAEGAPFDRAQLDALLDLAAAGIADLTEIQRTALASSS